MIAMFRDQPILGSCGADVYSTEETCIGMWIDGRPLYRIVKEINVNNSNGFQGIVYTGTEDQVIINLTPILKYPSEYTGGTVGNFYTSASNRATYWWTQTMDVYASLGSDVSSNVKIVLIIEYTKTSDSVTKAVVAPLAAMTYEVANCDTAMASAASAVLKVDASKTGGIGE